MFAGMKHKEKILIVDDSLYHRSELKKLLLENGYKVFESSDAIDGIQMMRKIHPDLVIMDINMPIMEGVDAVKYMKKVDRNALVIMFSSLDDEKSVMEAIKAGARDYVTKPLDKVKMLEAVERLLKSFSIGRNT